MKTFIFTSTFLLTCYLPLQSQKTKHDVITTDDLAMTSYPADPDAEAVYLWNTSEVTLQLQSERHGVTEKRHLAIKLLKESSLDRYGNIQIPFQTGQDFSKVGDVKGTVHLPDGSKVKVSNDNIFEEKYSDYLSIKKIAFPQLKPGAIIELQYVLISNNSFEPVHFFTQAEIPIRYTELTTVFPEWFDYLILFQGLPPQEKERRSYQDALTFQGGSYNVNTIFNQFISKEVPALKEECCITTMKDYFGSIRYRLSAVQFPQSGRQAILNSWKKLADVLYSGNWGGNIKNNRVGSSVLEAAGIDLASGLTQTAIANKLYQWINTNIQWNGWHSISTHRTVAEILKARSGDSGDLNKLMCTGLLHAGIIARPVLISTRDHGRVLELYPFLDQFNHLVVIAQLDGKDTWLDLGNKHLPVGMLQPPSLNHRGWIADELNPVWVDLKLPESKATYYVKGNLSPDGLFNGTLETRFTGYFNQHYRELEEKKEDIYGQDLLKNGKVNVSLTDITVTNKEDASMPFLLKANIGNMPVANASGDHIYLSHFTPAHFLDKPFKLERRTYPVEFNYPTEETVIMDIDIPQGYQVETLPASVRFVNESNGIEISYQASAEPAKVKVTMKYALRQLHFDPKEYDALKNIYDQRFQKFSELIVLKKT